MLLLKMNYQSDQNLVKTKIYFDTKYLQFDLSDYRLLTIFYVFVVSLLIIK